MTYWGNRAGTKSLSNKSVNKTNLKRTSLLVSAGLVATLLSGCGVGSFVGGSSDTTPASSALLANSSATQTEINIAAQSALPAIATECPPIKVRTGGEALYSYAGKKVGDAKALNFQAVIDNQSRNCVVSNGLITVKMGVVGRVLNGPVGSQESITIPIRFAVERDELAVFSQKYQIPVSIDPATRTGEFVKVVENVAIPYVGGEDIVIWVGFDSRS